MAKNKACMIISVLAGILAMTVGFAVNSVNYNISSLILLVSAVCLYLFIVLGVAERNWLDIRAIFAGVWLGTIGLATFRFAGYQKQWQTETWIIIMLAYAAFQIGATLGINGGRKWYPVVRKKMSGLKLGHMRFELQENRLFSICVIVTLIGLACFSINVAIKGFIPCFSDDVNAYKVFYTKFHIFSTAATSVSGLCYYCIRTQKLKLWKRIVLLLCIFYLVFAFPIMVVSRGVFIVVALSLAVSVFYMHKKKLGALILCLIVILGVYAGTSYLRNYTDGQLKVFFNATQPTDPPAEPTIPTESTVPTEGTEPTAPTEGTEPTAPTEGTEPTAPTEGTEPTEPMNPTEPVTPGDPQDQKPLLELSPKMLFLYGYLTVSHDNLNEAVLHLQEHTWGIRQLKPFNVILRNPWIEEKNEEAEYYQVNPYLNTTNLIGDFYYDFGMVGVGVFMLLWAIVFGIIQSVYECGKGPFALLALGNTMTPVALSFFSSWLSGFNFWMFWGVALLLAIAACLIFEHRRQ